MFKSSTEGVNSLTVDDVRVWNQQRGKFYRQQSQAAFLAPPDDAPVQIGADM